MVRSMYSGVSGLRSHQTRMDTIGNNIANVNTYGFKSGRTTFRDIYYQSMTNASGPTGAAGGVNPSQVGYGSKVGSVDVMMGRSTFTMTDQGMDVAIDGDGFLQVMDAAGNTYYTRAGMLNFDAIGNLVDMQGNYVLGVNGDPTGKAPGSERISVALPNVPPTPASMEVSINGKKYNLKAQNNTNSGNLNMTFSADSSMTDGEVSAEITATGISVRFSPEITYASMAEFNNAVNDAIKAANGGKEHPAGRFTLGAVGHNPFAEGPLKAEELCGTNYGIKNGTLDVAGSGNYYGGINFTGKVGSEFSGVAADLSGSNFSMTYSNGKFTFQTNIGGVNYIGEIDSSKTASGKFNLYKDGVKGNDYIEMDRPSYNDIVESWRATQPNPNGTKTEATFTGTTFPTASPSSVVVDGVTVSYDGTVADFISKYNASTGAKFTARLDSGNVAFTAKDVGATPNPVITGGPTLASATAGTPVPTPDDPVWGINGTSADPTWKTTTYPLTGSATASAPSRDLGFSGTSFALRGGTEGGAQTIADMTGISIAPNGVIVGLDSVGNEIMIGRIDLATFANAAGLNQSGSSNFSESANSGVPILTTPGQEGAGQLVTGSLELSNVDLSREFSDMITTQRGYQANSRIITVSDTMLEELINLKR